MADLRGRRWVIGLRAARKPAESVAGLPRRLGVGDGLAAVLQRAMIHAQRYCDRFGLEPEDWFVAAV